MDEVRTKTLYDIQEGDEVLLVSMYWERVVTVSRLTKCYIIIGNEKYRKDGGFKVTADRWSTEHIRIVSPKDIERIKNRQKHERLVLEAKAISFQSLTSEQLQSIIDIASKK